MSETAQDAIWTALPVPALLTDGADRVIAINPAAENFLNVPITALQGRDAGACLGLRSDLGASLGRVRATRAGLLHRDVVLRIQTDRPIACDLRIALLGGTDSRMMILVLPHAIAGGLGDAERIRSARRTAIGLGEMLAHEIKNPLAGIAGAAQLIEMQSGDGSREMTQLILEETRRIVDLLAQVERFGDLRPPKLEPVNIHDVLERARLSAALGVAAQMRFCDDYDPSLPETHGDEGQLSQVMANLFANAAEAAGAGGGTITIRTFFQPGLRLLSDGGDGRALPLQVEIIDDGPGISPDLADHVFEPFVSGRENGTGLGLALVSKIIGDHGGAVALDSRPGCTKVRISLPVAATGKGG